MSKADEGEIVEEEEEESGEEDDMGKYMFGSDDEDEKPEQKAEVKKPEVKTDEQKPIQSLREFMAESIPSLKSFKGNKLPVHGNERTMNLNHLILANITESAYFRTDLVQHRSYDDMIDEIYYRVQHLEPWEKGSRKAFTGSSTGGERGLAYSSIPGVSNYVGVRGVGQGGIVSTPFCCLYKLWTLKLNRHQIMKMLNHSDSPYIRGLGFLYLRFSLAPEHLLPFFEDYLEDEDEIDPKAGGGDPMTIGQMVQMLLEDNQWYGTMFPRIPAKHLKEIRDRIRDVRGGSSGNRSQSDKRDTSRRERSRSPQRKKRRDPRDLDDRPSSSNNRAYRDRQRDDYMKSRPPKEFRSSRY